jgi:hypothetical protein
MWGREMDGNEGEEMYLDKDHEMVAVTLGCVDQANVYKLFVGFRTTS